MILHMDTEVPLVDYVNCFITKLWSLLTQIGMFNGYVMRPVADDMNLHNYMHKIYI